MLVMPRPLLSNAQLQTGNTRANGVLPEHAPRSADSAKIDDSLASRRVHAPIDSSCIEKRVYLLQSAIRRSCASGDATRSCSSATCLASRIRDRCGPAAPAERRVALLRPHWTGWLMLVLIWLPRI